MNITVRDAAKACGGELPDDLDPAALISGVSTDTRDNLEGKLFIPLKGPTFDGHAFITDAYAKGAVAALSERGGERVIAVESTLKALADIALYYRNRFSLPIVAITGSAGKTTTKDLTASVLSQGYKTLKTEGNLNNEIGLPRMVFRLDGSYTAAVLEMGMNHAGEIHNLSRIARPDICVITNIGVAHIENLGSREGILAAKAEIFDYMADDGVRVLNGDDDLLSKSAETERARDGRVITYSAKDSSADVWADEIQSEGLFRQSCVIHANDRAIRVEITPPGVHMVSNVLAAATVGCLMGLNLEQIKTGIEAFIPSKNRMDITRSGDIEIINDVYNANPDSMEAAISVLAGAPNHTAAILGDMFELGGFAPELHYRVGKAAAESNVRTLICVGELSGHIFQGFTDNKSGEQEAFHFKTKEECGEAVNRLIKPDSTVLVKASRGMGLEYIVETLKRGKEDQHG
ncbi:MAG: UDP-N-acetylmuramoyl-tripeptide--D-alanyl-D-alanine ligase [Clostridiales bacterium]|jgi:UDP-N-acetylmuramoyl-tripeptide--D-alanyl-D-alanine ligase|nr:UDP-N-acetylmuramoyl-tripeptide--D-alanyl-D-alanine ligase [Clostridiales bacterium]